MSEERVAAVRVVCFGALRERLGSETLVREPVATVAELWAALTRDLPPSQASRDGVRAARNLAYCDWDTPVGAGAEVAFMPPVAGGATDELAPPRLVTAVQSVPIDVVLLARQVRGDADGALAGFAGVVREENGGRPVLRLDYEAYLPMAERELLRIAGELAARHRLGGLALAVIAAAAHRREALAACAEAVEAVKRDLPVWKREHHPEGAVWVDAREDGAAAGTVAPLQLSHLDGDGAVRMVDVGDRPATLRVATAEATVRFSHAGVLEALRAGAPKGDVGAAARLAGIMAAKRTPELIPLCHPIPLSHVEVLIEVVDPLPGMRIVSTARCTASTGVEMEALTAASVAALTVIDMLKSADPWITVEAVRLLSKSGGRSGELRRP